ncbi:hypothetical protein PHEL85_3307 [Polaribacter sp. Hel1_85]|nr:hypothetical protein PHEL85_3307 [Polaribacter sp. Hel1_85]
MILKISASIGNRFSSNSRFPFSILLKLAESKFSLAAS